MSKKYLGDAMAAVHRMMEDLYDDAVIDSPAMRRFDAACLMPVRPLKPKGAKAARERKHSPVEPSSPTA
jgi:putative transcriptional regulator